MDNNLNLRKDELTKKYSKLKKYSYALISLWLIGIAIALLGLFLAMSIGFDKIPLNTPEGEPKKFTSSINNVGIGLLAGCFSFGIIVALIAQFILPIFLKKELLKSKDENYTQLMILINKCFIYPISGGMGIVRQIDWIINYKDINDANDKVINDFIKEKENLTRLELEKKEQEKLNKIYEEESNNINDNNSIKKEKKKSSKPKQSANKTKTKNKSSNNKK